MATKSFFSFRRHYSRPCGQRPEGRTKHVPLEVGLHSSDDHLSTPDGALLGAVSNIRHNHNQIPHPILGTVGVTTTGVIDTQCRGGNGVVNEDTDPDIIRNQYGIKFIGNLKFFSYFYNFYLMHPFFLLYGTNHKNIHS